MKKIELTTAERIVLTEKMQDQFTKWQKFHSQQTTQTSIDVITDIINNLNVTGKSLAVISNIDIFVCIQYLDMKYNLGIAELTFVTDVKALRDKPNVIYVESFKEINLNKKFDVAILNPPYDMGLNKRYGRQVAFQLIPYVNEMVTILPYSHISTMGTKSLANYGLTTMSRDISNLFKIKLTNVRYFYFNKANINQLNVNDVIRTHAHTMPDIGLDVIFRNGGGHETFMKSDDLIKTFKSTGKVKLFTSGTQSGYISDDVIINHYRDSDTDKYRVVVSRKTGWNIGTLDIAMPGDIVSTFARYFVCDSIEQALKLKEYMESDDVVNRFKSIITSSSNSKKFFKYIPLPDFLK